MLDSNSMGLVVTRISFHMCMMNEALLLIRILVLHLFILLFLTADNLSFCIEDICT